MRLPHLFLVLGMVFFVLAMGAVNQEPRSLPIIVILWLSSAALIFSGVLLIVREKKTRSSR
jgi:cytochrome c-type biogenesis protein CcmH/NrfF